MAMLARLGMVARDDAATGSGGAVPVSGLDLLAARLSVHQQACNIRIPPLGKRLHSQEGRKQTHRL